MLELFKAPRSGNLSTARFFRYRAVTQKPEPAGDKEGEPAPADRVIARFDDGAIAMAERKIGSGHVIIWSSTLDNYWNDLALKPVYLPVRPRGDSPSRRPTRSRRTGSPIGDVIDPGHLLRSSGLGMQSGTGAMVLTPAGSVSSSRARRRRSSSSRPASTRCAAARTSRAPSASPRISTRSNRI